MIEIPAQGGSPYRIERSGGRVHLSRNLVNRNGTEYTSRIVMTAGDVVTVCNALIDLVESG